jgi:hypothetical protein
MVRAMNDLRRQEMGDIGYDECQRGRRESPPGILGTVILVMSGPGRMMYLCLEPKPEVAIFSKRSKPQGTNSSPHDTGASIANWLASNIQGDVAKSPGRLGKIGKAKDGKRVESK